MMLAPVIALALGGTPDGAHRDLSFDVGGRLHARRHEANESGVLEKPRHDRRGTENEQGGSHPSRGDQPQNLHRMVSMSR